MGHLQGFCIDSGISGLKKDSRYWLVHPGTVSLANFWHPGVLVDGWINWWQLAHHIAHWVFTGSKACIMHADRQPVQTIFYEILHEFWTVIFPWLQGKWSNIWIMTESGLAKGWLVVEILSRHRETDMSPIRRTGSFGHPAFWMPRSFKNWSSPPFGTWMFKP